MNNKEAFFKAETILAKDETKLFYVVIFVKLLIFNLRSFLEEIKIQANSNKSDLIWP